MDDLSVITTPASIDMTTIYGLIGVVVVGQFGTIITMVVWLLKAAWKASEMNSAITELKKDMDAAFKNIRAIELAHSSKLEKELNELSNQADKV